MIRITRAEFDEMDKLARVQLATTLPGVKPICLVGTRSSDGVANLAPFSSVTHLGSNPPLLGMVTRPDTVERHTLANILAAEEWTLSHLHEGIFSQGHQCSARYPAEVSEFAATGLKEAKLPGMAAPAVAEARVRIGMKLEEIVDLKINNTKLVIGSVAVLEIEQDVDLEDGRLDLVELGTMGSTALDTYFSLKDSFVEPYAKVRE